MNSKKIIAAIGSFGVTLGGLVAAGAIPAAWVKYAVGLLTVIHGIQMFTGSVAAQAQTVPVSANSTDTTKGNQ